MRKKYVQYPTIQKFSESNALVRCLLGPIGSGKSVAATMEILRRASEQEPSTIDGVRRTRFAVVRNTYAELRDTTVKTYDEWLGDFGKFKASEMVFYLKFKDKDGILVESEILFRALDRPEDIKKLLSLELTGAWVNEAKEVQGEVIQNLISRTGRYPSKAVGGATWSGVWLDSNMPSEESFIYKMFEEERPEGWEIFKQPGGLAPNAENVENLPATYYTSMMAGKEDRWLKVYRDATYGLSMSGKAVFPEFAESLHLKDDLKPIPNLPLTIGLDFGRTPVAVIGQVTKKGEVYIIDELQTFDTGTNEFARLLREKLDRDYRGYPIKVYGDPSGITKNAHDETEFDILKAHKIFARPCRTNDPAVRQEAVRSKLTHIIDGHAALLVGKNANWVRKGLRGGYIFKRIQTAGNYFQEKADKNEYSHSMDALQYLMVESVGVGGIKQGQRFGSIGSTRHNSLGTNKYWADAEREQRNQTASNGQSLGPGSGFSWNY